MAKSDETSIWKKEITLRRKPKPKPAPEVATPAETSVWKKEITFRRKPKAQPAQAEGRQSAPPREPAPASRPALEPAPPRVEPQAEFVPPPVTALVAEPTTGGRRARRGAASARARLDASR